MAGDPAVPLDRLEFDSLAWMEFCISVELQSRLELTPADIASMQHVLEIEEWLRARLVSSRAPVPTDPAGQERVSLLQRGIGVTAIDSEPGKSGYDAPVSPFAILQGHAHRQPASEAVWTRESVLTCAELFDRIAACANSLLHNGLRPGEVTGVAIRDEIHNLVCAAALLCLGTPQICLASHDPPRITARLRAA